MPKNSALAALLTIAVLVGGCAKSTSSDDPEMIGDEFPADTASIQDELPPEGSYAETDTPPESQAAPEDMTSYESSQPSASVDFGGATENYTVQAGDTLMKIAFNVYGDIEMWRKIYELNRDVLTNPKALRVGQSIRYNKPSSSPNISRVGEPYLIKSGDTLGKISMDVYATSKKWRKLYENNRELIKDPNRIYAGFYLYYQMTEEEKQWAESHRGGMASSEPQSTLPRGTASVPSDSAPLAPGENVSVSPADAPERDLVQ
jgi:LysM repeat protein